MGISCLHTSTKAVHKFVVFQAPSGKGKKAGRGLGNKAFENKVWTQAFYEINDKVNIFVGSEEMEVGRLLRKLLRH